jgi:hypothetical protein
MSPIRHTFMIENQLAPEYYLPHVLPINPNFLNSRKEGGVLGGSVSLSVLPATASKSWHQIRKFVAIVEQLTIQ